MTIKNPHIIHFVRNGRYICIGACRITKVKSTKERNKVTCKNCKRKLKKKKWQK